MVTESAGVLVADTVASVARDENWLRFVFLVRLDHLPFECVSSFVLGYRGFERPGREEGFGLGSFDIPGLRCLESEIPNRVRSDCLRRGSEGTAAGI